MRFTDLQGRRVVVWGAGREGRAAADACARRGIATTTVVTSGDAGQDTDAVAELVAADVVVKSPGVPISGAAYRQVVDAGVALTSGTDLWLGEHARQVVGVTGSKGKSTTAMLLAHLLRASGRAAALVGNIGVPVLDTETQSHPGDTVFVVELSSYQCQSLTVSPRVAVLTELFPEHLPWHGGVEAYYRDKLNIAAHGPELVVANGRNAELRDRLSSLVDAPLLRFVDETSAVHVDADGALRWGGVGTLAADRLGLPGRHNAWNAALAVTALRDAGLVGDDPAVLDALRTVRALEHRLEPVPSADGRHWYDDSLATAPQAVVAALEVFADRHVALVFGGADRGLDLTLVLEHLRRHADRVEVLCIGPAGHRFAAQLASEAPQVRARTFDGLAAATGWASSADDPADTVLLSPGAPSFDEFADYEARSAAFRALALVQPAERRN